MLRSDNKPGPGQYEVNKSTLLANKNLGNFFKSKYFEKQKFDNVNVGPGQYNFNYNFIKKRPQQCKFGTQKKHQENKK